MMHAQIDHPTSSPTGPIQFHLSSNAAQGVLAFDVLHQPDMGLAFLPRPPPARPKKRSRAVADIDGEHSCIQKKKRRLRLFLITSRLSPQFSHPASNIVDRGSSKIAVWAKQKGLGRNLLRKGAILNSIRRQTSTAKEVEEGRGRSLVQQEREQQQLQLAKLEFDHGAVDTYTRPVVLQTYSVPPAVAVRTGDHFVVSGSPSSSPSSSRSPSPTPPSPPLRGVSDESVTTYRSPNEAYAYSPPRAQIPRRDYVPLPPSPLGTSNYDAFDLDAHFSAPYSPFDDEYDEPIPYPYANDEDEGPNSTSDITTTCSPTVEPNLTQAVNSPSQRHDIDDLDYDEAVLVDHDQIEDDSDSIWPSTYAENMSTLSPGSRSPNFPALFATASSSSKRTDSFAMSPNLRPAVITQSTSPNFSPASSVTLSATSPNFLPSSTLLSASPNFTTSVTPASASPKFEPLSVSPNFVPISMSPNFAHIPASSPNFGAADEPQLNATPTVRARRQSDIDQERKRQRDLMFMPFGS